MASAIIPSSCPTESAPRPEDPMPPPEVSRLELTGFKQVASSIWIYTASNKPRAATVIADSAKAPALVVLCPWTGAMLRHIAVYTELYKTLYSSAEIMVITTSLIDICFRSSKSKQKRLASALKFIPSDQQLMIHVFSEGGSNKACELAEAFRTEKNDLLPVKAFCLDSAPGKPHYRRLCKAFSKALPPWPMVEPIGLVLGGIILGCKWIFYDHVKGFEHNVVSKTRDRLLDNSLWDHTMPRCYLFSEGDELICSKEIRNHAAELVRLGTRVEIIDFGDSGHVQHARLHPVKYKEAISKFWQGVSCL